jgi:hypothetical protein
MQDFPYLARFALGWVTSHPYTVAGVVFALVALTWLLNRRSKIDRENERVVKNLVEGSRGKYNDLRPLR